MYILFKFHLINFSIILLQDDIYAKQATNITYGRKLLKNKIGKHSLEGLVMVDTMHRLGINHYFQEEIELFLKWQYMLMTETSALQYTSLSELSLGFRLMRQEGYYISAGTTLRIRFSIVFRITNLLFASY